jgi:hypothetical protein
VALAVLDGGHFFPARSPRPHPRASNRQRYWEHRYHRSPSASFHQIELGLRVTYPAWGCQLTLHRTVHLGRCDLQVQIAMAGCPLRHCRCDG